MNINVIYWTMINLWVEHKTKGFKINSLLIELTPRSSYLVMWTKMSNAVFTWLLSLHYEMETLWGREGINVSHSGNNVPSLMKTFSVHYSHWYVVCLLHLHFFDSLPCVLLCVYTLWNVNRSLSFWNRASLTSLNYSSGNKFLTPFPPFVWITF